MIRILLILFTLASYAVSDQCVSYTFEQNFNEWLKHNWDPSCINKPVWTANNYSNFDSLGQNEQSSIFITPTPQSQISCVSSFIFTMQRGGTIEVNIYMEAQSVNEIIVSAQLLSNPYVFLGNARNTAGDFNFVRGWHTLRITLGREGTYEGYINIMGKRSQNSIVLVDSFRYIPPGRDENDCRLYEIEDEPTTPEPTTAEPTTPRPTTPVPTAPEPTTPETTTPEPTTAEPTTPRPTTPEPTTPEPTTPVPTTPEPTTPEPTTPESTTPRPTTPEPTTPKPTTPKPTTPEPTTPEPTTPRPTTPEPTTPEPTSTNQKMFLMKWKMMLKLT